MCGRFALDDKVNEAISKYVASGGKAEDWRPSNWEPNFNTAPTNTSVIVRDRAHSDTGVVEREVEWDAVWDFRPQWMKKPAPQINARIENLLSSNLWKPAFLARRAIVPMNGYYEWKAIAGKKQPFFIHAPEDFLSAAGIYVSVKVGDEWQQRFAIITREARDASGEIHDRMPAFLTPEVWNDWLEPGELDRPEETVAMLTESSERIAKTITTYPVSKRINNVRAEPEWTDPHILDEVEV